MFIISSVSFSSQNHPIVRFCLKLRLWSKPTLNDAESTASILCQLIWVILGFSVLIYSFDLVTLFVVCGCVDLTARMFGVRSSIFFVPLWILACGGCLIFMGAFDR